MSDTSTFRPAGRHADGRPGDGTAGAATGGGTSDAPGAAPGDTTDFGFDTVIDRCDRGSYKWDKYRGTEVIPLWVADMDFRSPPAVVAALQERVAHGVFGYGGPPAGWWRPYELRCWPTTAGRSPPSG